MKFTSSYQQISTAIFGDFGAIMERFRNIHKLVFRRLRKITKSDNRFHMSVCLSVRLQGTTRL